MAIHSTELTPTDLQALVELATKSRDDTLQEAVDAYLARRGKASAPNGSPTSEPEVDDVDLVAEYRELFPGYEPGRQRVSRERVCEILSKIPESLSAELIADREDRL